LPLAKKTIFVLSSAKWQYLDKTPLAAGNGDFTMNLSRQAIIFAGPCQ